MDKGKEARKRIIRIESGVIGPSEPRVRNVKPKKPGDYPSLSKYYLEAAKKFSSPLLMGPPICDELIAIVEHIFTEEEADLFSHLKPLTRGQTVDDLVRASNRPESEVKQVLHRLAHEKRIIIESGPEGKKRYFIMPLVPGVFESVLMRTDKSTISEWHQKFAELFETIWETGYLMDYAKYPAAAPLTRYIPAQQAVTAIPMAWPSDKMEEILDMYDKFAVGHCQCRMTMELTGQGCGKETENCVAFGDIVDYLVRQDMMREIGKKDVLEIKAAAEKDGMVSWMFNESSGLRSSGSCSCCGCCCHNLRSITEFNVPGLIAPPHFMPRFLTAKCNHCGKCARACPMGAITVDTKGKTRVHAAERCVGCGLCQVACDEHKAIEMSPTPNYKGPESGWPTLVAKMLPSFARNAWSVWRSR